MKPVHSLWLTHPLTPPFAVTLMTSSGVKQLLLGHYSQRYEDENVLLNEAQEVFPNSILTYESGIFDV